MSETPEGAERVELILAFNRFADKADALLKGGTNQTVTLSGGSFGIWISAFAAVVCFLMFLVVLLLFVNHDRKIDTLDDYVNAIYMMAPHLKPPEKKE